MIETVFNYYHPQVIFMMMMDCISLLTKYISKPLFVAFPENYFVGAVYHSISSRS